MSVSPLYRITLHLARSKEFPSGTSLNRYVITAPLDSENRLDPAAWKMRRAQCTVERVNGRETRGGLLVHRHGGAGGATWAIDYDASRDDDDEAGYRLSSHSFLTGEYVSIRGEDDELHTFRVADVELLE
jgi:hypothetical protein